MAQELTQLHVELKVPLHPISYGFSWCILPTSNNPHTWEKQNCRRHFGMCFFLFKSYPNLRPCPSWSQHQDFKTHCYLAVWGEYLQSAWIDNYIFPCSKNNYKMGVAASSAKGAEATEQSPWAVVKSVQQPHSFWTGLGEGTGEESPFSTRFSPPEIWLKQLQVLLSQGIGL